MENSKFSRETIAEVEAKRKIIDAKLKIGATLTNEELWMIGNQMHLDILPQHVQCMDMYYRRLYIHYMEDIGHTFGPLAPEHVFNFQMQVHAWSQMLKGEYPIGSLFAASGNTGEIDHPKPEQTDHLKGWRKLSNFAGEDFQFSADLV